MMIMPAEAYLVSIASYFLSLAGSSHGYGVKNHHLEIALGPAVQQYAVGALPSVNFQMPTSWAGQIPIPGTPNDELFFWLFQAEEPSNDLISGFYAIAFEDTVNAHSLVERRSRVQVRLDGSLAESPLGY